MEKAKGVQLNGTDSLGGYRLQPPSETPTYSDLGIDKRDAHYWQPWHNFSPCPSPKPIALSHIPLYDKPNKAKAAGHNGGYCKQGAPTGGAL